MRVKCTASNLTPEQRMLLGRIPGDVSAFHFTPGNEYVVIGLQFAVNSNVLGTGVWVHVVNDYEKLSWAPIVLFEVTDPKVSALWRVDAAEENQVRLWPELLYTPFFHEDLGEGDPAAAEAFALLLRALEMENEK